MNKKASQTELTQENKKSIEEMRKEESRIVRGVFRCHEPKGGSVKFPFRKYKGDPIEVYEMIDGQEYEVPLAVARHLNQNCRYPIHSHVLDAQGKPTEVVGKYVQRFEFNSLEFFA